MLAYPNISPVALSLGPVQVHWYGLMYLFAFLAGWGLARWRASRPAWIAAGWNGQKVDDLLTWIMLGVVAGGRLGYVLFYDLPVYLDQPSEIFKIWNGGMSFHGGLIGVLLMGWWWSRRNKKKFMDVVDFVAPLVPPGLFFGRIGNFINGELWGGVTDGPLGMVFPTGGPLPRHPSQLYEAGLEGLVLFVVLWVYSSRSVLPGAFPACSRCCTACSVLPWSLSASQIPSSAIWLSAGSRWGSFCVFLCLSRGSGCCSGL